MECGPFLPDILVLEIFLRLPHDAVLRAGLTCRQWLAVSRDEFLWRELFYSYYRIPRTVPQHPGGPLASSCDSFFAPSFLHGVTQLCVRMQRPCRGTGSSSASLTVSRVSRFKR